ncbi:MAG TPA: carbamoyltransferase C-terminal domain-containing protein, partial [Nitrospiraceae bacterium]|nr:carbamoyltransferase C-terminal domain-containing protein [Nitrospiraceae bacterium]
LLNMRDSAAALVRDGRILAAAEEERFVRVKHVTALPVHAIRYCLQEAGAELADVDGIAVPWKYWVLGRRATLALGAMLRSPTLFRVKGRRSVERLSQEWPELALLASKLHEHLGTGLYRPVYYDHHLCHAASSFLVSPFEQAAILIVDGASEAHTAMLAVGEGREITVLKRVALPHSLGQFYAAMTSYLGFRPDQDEYIVMGLAAYGEPRFAGLLREQVLRLLPDGSFRLNTKRLDFHLARVRIFLPEFLRLLGPNRLPSEELTQRHRDIAASAQVVLEEAMLHLARHLQHLTGAKNLCLAGGVAYNCVANSRIQRELNYQEVYVQPAAGDAGSALGAALWLTYRRGWLSHREVMRDVYLGPEFSEEDCRKALSQAGLVWEALSEDVLCDRVATELERGRLVFWFQGRMEWGPRALGNRSLLADPRREDMRELINAKVKLREPFRPFAPSVLEECAAEYFDSRSPSPFMLFTAPVLPSAKGIIPAVVHVDGTSRIQTVGRDENPRFRKLLEAFARKTGVPILLNTSFNVNEPIVCNPEEAIQCFLRTDVDWLVLGNLLVRRPLHVNREA